MVRVHCPFCLRTHSHDPGSLDFEHDSPSDASLKSRRAPHCGHLLDDYQMCFPFEDPDRGRGYSWFLDKIERKYVTVGPPPEIELENYFVAVSNGSEDQDHISIATSDSADSVNDPADDLAEEFQSKAPIEDVGVDLRQFYRARFHAMVDTGCSSLRLPAYIVQSYYAMVPSHTQHDDGLYLVPAREVLPDLCLYIGEGLYEVKIPGMFLKAQGVPDDADGMLESPYLIMIPKNKATNPWLWCVWVD